MNIIKDAVQANQKIIFNVTNPRKSYSGYTIYRITLQVCLSLSIYYKSIYFAIF